MPKCGVAKVYAVMSDEDVKALKSLLSAPIPSTAVARELAAAGHAVSYQTVRRHKTGLCSCGSI